MLRYAAICFALVLTAPGRLFGEETRARAWLHLNGYSHHFAAGDANEKLVGLGATWYVDRWGKTTRAWEADVFRDSGCKLSGYVGHSWTYRMPHASAGVTAALMYHRNFAKQNSLRLLPVALPYAEIPLGRVSLRAYYIPPVRSASDHQIALQILAPIWR